MSIVKIYKNAVEIFNKEIDVLDKHNVRKCICCKGCDACCYQIFSITDFEAKVIKKIIKKLPEDLKNYVKNRAERNSYIMQELNLAPENFKNIGVNNINKELQKHIQELYFKNHIACPFLKDNQCIIHDYRPIACFTYRAYTEENTYEKDTRSKCFDSPFSGNCLTFNDVEYDMRDYILENTDCSLSGFNLLSFVVLDAFKKESLWQKFLKLMMLENDENDI